MRTLWLSIAVVAVVVPLLPAARPAERAEPLEGIALTIHSKELTKHFDCSNVVRVGVIVRADRMDVGPQNFWQGRCSDTPSTPEDGEALLRHYASWVRILDVTIEDGAIYGDLVAAVDRGRSAGYEYVKVQLEPFELSGDRVASIPTSAYREP